MLNDVGENADNLVHILSWELNYKQKCRIYCFTNIWKLEIMNLSEYFIPENNSKKINIFIIKILIKYCECLFISLI